MSEVKPARTTTDYEDMRAWRQAERAHMVEAIRDTIEEARRRAKSPHTPAGEKIRWTRLVGQLIWYKDSILKAMSYEALEKEVAGLKAYVFNRTNQPPPTASPRRTIKGSGGLSIKRITRTAVPTLSLNRRKKGSPS